MNLIATAGPSSSSTPFDILTTSPGPDLADRARHTASLLLPGPDCLTYEFHPIIPDAIWTGNFAMRCMEIESRL